MVVHRTSAWHEKDLLASARPPRTKPARAIVDAAQWAAGDDRARALVAAGGSHSLAEINFIALCRKHGLPEPARQVVRVDTAG